MQMASFFQNIFGAVLGIGLTTAPIVVIVLHLHI
jgi:hypothetical protein